VPVDPGGARVGRRRGGWRWYRLLMRLQDETAALIGEYDVDDPEVMLRTHHCRATGPRIAVLRALLRHGGPIDIATLTTLAQSEAPDIHEATVYRTIGVLSDRGIVTHVHAGHGPSLVRLGADHGLIAVCRDCSRITELPAGTVERFIAEAHDAIGFTLEPGHFALEGVCSHCA